MIKLNIHQNDTVIVVALSKKAAFKLMFNKLNDSLYYIDDKLDYRGLKKEVETLLKYAVSTPNNKFYITSTLGPNVDLAPMFVNAPSNCILPFAFKDILGAQEGRLWWYA